jgi:hypothetical protein
MSSCLTPELEDVGVKSAFGLRLGNKRSKTGPFTPIMVPCNEYADLAMEAITAPVCSQTYGAPLNYLCWLVGTQVYNRYAVKYKEKSGVVEKVRYMVHVLILFLSKLFLFKVQ